MYNNNIQQCNSTIMISRTLNFITTPNNFSQLSFSFLKAHLHTPEGNFCRDTWCNFCCALSCNFKIDCLNSLQFGCHGIAYVSNVLVTWCNSERNKNCIKLCNKNRLCKWDLNSNSLLKSIHFSPKTELRNIYKQKFLKKVIKTESLVKHFIFTLDFLNSLIIWTNTCLSWRFEKSRGVH